MSKPCCPIPEPIDDNDFDHDEVEDEDEDEDNPNVVVLQYIGASINNLNKVVRELQASIYTLTAEVEALKNHTPV